MHHSTPRLHSSQASPKRKRPEPLHKRNPSGRLRLRPAYVWVLTGAICTASTSAQQPPPPPAEEEYLPAVPSPAALANPAIRATLERERITAGDHLRATLNLLDLGEPELATNAFRDLLALELDDAAKAQLVSEFGTAAMLRLTRAPELGPDAAAFVDSVMAAAAAQATSDERIAELVDQLGSDNQPTRRSAVAALAGAGQPAVIKLISALADPATSEASRQGIRAALVRLGPLAEGPLLATLDSGDRRLEAEAATILATLGTAQAAPLIALTAAQSSGGSAIEQAYISLTGQDPTLDSVIGLLTRTLETVEGSVPVFVADADGTVTYWVWSNQAEEGPRPVPLTLSANEANLAYAAELATQLNVLRPGDPTMESKAMRLSIEASGILRSATTAPELNDLAAPALDRLLADALAENQVAAARQALAVVAERRDPGMLYTPDGRPSPTARALEHPHPAISTAALDAIAAINSPTPFPGASYVRPAVVRLAAAGGKREVLVGAPQLDAAATWAGGLAVMGFDGQVAATGQDVVELAGQRADIEMVLIDMAIGQPTVRDVVFQLRRQPGTGLVPIGLLARESQLPAARRIAFEHERVLAFPRPHDDAALSNIATTLMAQLPRYWPTREQRLAQADRAIEVANSLLASDQDFYRLRAASAMIAENIRPGAANAASWQLLAQLGTRESQVALLAYTSAPAVDLETRRRAAEAFTDSVQRFGVRLTSEEIVRQYDLYNASETDTRDVQQLLGSILDAIEAGKAPAPPSPH